MTLPATPSTTQHTHWIILLVFIPTIILLAGILHFSGSMAFYRFIGKLHPLLFAIFIITLGVAGLSLLVKRRWYSIWKQKNLNGILYGSSLALPFGFIIIMVDLLAVLPEDVNILFPESLLFYPLMGFAAEILFHVVPLAIVLLVLTFFFKQLPDRTIIWVSILIVAAIEPAYQIYYGFSEEVKFWVTAYVGLHIFAINICQLVIFRRFDFVSMLTFRLTYYALWHIGWGYFRLQLLY